MAKEKHCTSIDCESRRSKCCNTKSKVFNGEEGTSYYKCSTCGNEFQAKEHNCGLEEEKEYIESEWRVEQANQLARHLGVENRQDVGIILSYFDKVIEEFKRIVLMKMAGKYCECHCDRCFDLDHCCNYKCGGFYIKNI